MIQAKQALVALLITSVLVPILSFGTVVGALLFLPLPAALPTPKAGIESRITHVYDVGGAQIALLHRFETSIPVRRTDIPEVLKQAVVAAEDRRFYSHGGVDTRAVLRALLADVRGGHYVQGGSTITQQYVKSAYTGNRRTILRKLREAVIASQLNRKVPKDVVLYRYLSNVYFGSGAYGIGAAAESYFRKPVGKLTLSESALLAGMIHSPTSLDPRTNPSGAEDQRTRVLDQMLSQHRISQSEHDDASSQTIYVLSALKPPPLRQATLIQPVQQQDDKYPAFVDYVRRYLIARYGFDKVYKGGLKVETTLDPVLQGQATKAVADALSGTSAPLSQALVSMEPATGYVKAMVGGRDFDKTSPKSDVNLALGDCSYVPKEPPDALSTCFQGGGSGRQPGSAFKPFTLAAAFEAGINPSRPYNGPPAFTIPNCRGVGCTVHNVEEEGGFGSISLRQALWHSVNTVFAQVILDVGDRKLDHGQFVGVKKTAEMAHRLGITMVNPDGIDLRPGHNREPYPVQLTLGVQEVSPLDMASAYGVFAARGLKPQTTPVLRVTDANGKVLEDHTKLQPKRVLPENVADNVTDVMRGVITGGTGRAADIGRPAAGKTGTSEDFHDAWFVGYTPTLSTAIWMGNAAGEISLQNIKGVAKVYGGTIPAQTWHNFMSEALKDVPATDFNEPAPINAPLAPGNGEPSAGFPRPTDLAGPPSTFGAYVPPPPPVEIPSLPPETTSTSSTTSTTRPRGLLLFPPPTSSTTPP